jgi:RimJ/RimL family protein N-acetyltransferase
MPTPQTWQGERLQEPLTLMGRHARLEPLVPAHAPDLYWAGQAPDIWRYVAAPQGPFASVPDAAQWVAHALADHAAGVGVPLALIVLATGSAMGRTGYFWETRWAKRPREIGGTWLCPDFWRTAASGQVLRPEPMPSARRQRDHGHVMDLTDMGERPLAV